MKETSQLFKERVVLNEKEKERAQEIISAFTPKYQTVCVADIEGSLTHDINNLFHWINSNQQKDEMAKAMMNIDDYDFKSALKQLGNEELSLYKRNNKYYVIANGLNSIFMAIAKYDQDLLNLTRNGKTPSQAEIDALNKKYSINILVYNGDASEKVAQVFAKADDVILENLPPISKDYILKKSPKHNCGAKLVYTQEGGYLLEMQGRRIMTKSVDEIISFIKETVKETKGLCAFKGLEGEGYVISHNVAFVTYNYENYKELIDTYNLNEEKEIDDFLLEISSKEKDCYNIYRNSQEIEMPQEELDAFTRFIYNNFDEFEYKLEPQEEKSEKNILKRINETKAFLNRLEYKNLNNNEVEAKILLLRELEKRIKFDNMLEK